VTVRTHDAATPPLSAWALWATAGAAVSYLALTAWIFWRSAVLQPYADMFEWIARYFAFRQDGDWAAYLLAPHNLHRLPFTHALVAADIAWLGGTNWPLIVSGGVALAAMAAMLALEAAQAAATPLKVPAAVLAAAATLMAANVLDAALPINANYVHAAAFAVAAILLAEGRERTPLATRGLAALACAAAAGLGNAAGLAVWPVLAYGAARRGDSRWLLAVAITGATFVALYLSGQDREGAGVLASAAGRPLDAVLTGVNFLTLPWMRIAPHQAWIAGLAIAGLSALALARRGGRGAPAHERIACGLILFALGAAAMAALGRTGLESPLATPLRYAVFVAPLHAGLLILALPYAERLLVRHRRTGEALVVASLATILAQNLAIAPKVIWVADVNRELVAAFRAGDRSPQVAQFVYPDLDRAQALSARLQAEGLYRDELHLKPRPPARYAASLQRGTSDERTD